MSSAASLIVMILVATGEGAEPEARAVRPAIEQTARRPVSVSLRESATVPDEAEAAWLAADTKVDVVVEVGWTGHVHDHAIVHVHGRDGRLLGASELAFTAAEPGAERGRAIGFAIATMLTDEPVAAGIIASTEAAESSLAARNEPEPQAPVAPAPAPVRAATTTTGGAVPREERAPAVGDERRFAIEGAGSAVADAGGATTGGGPVLRLQWNVARDFGLRIGGVARWLTSDGQRASEMGGAAGVLWTFARGRHLAGGARAELGVLHDAFTQEVAGGTNPAGKPLPARITEHSSWVPSLLVGAEADWRFGSAMAAFAALNLEAAPRAVAVETRANPSPLWASLEGGVRFSF